jgi:hypothetical protein
MMGAGVMLEKQARVDARCGIGAILTESIVALLSATARDAHRRTPAPATSTAGPQGNAT